VTKRLGIAANQCCQIGSQSSCIGDGIDCDVVNCDGNLACREELYSRGGTDIGQCNRGKAITFNVEGERDVGGASSSWCTLKCLYSRLMARSLSVSWICISMSMSERRKCRGKGSRIIC
jgi:hypothetical protein